MAVRKPPAESVRQGLPKVPDDLRQHPPIPVSVDDYVAWRERRRRWFADHDALTPHGAPDWTRVDRG